MADSIAFYYTINWAGEQALALTFVRQVAAGNGCVTTSSPSRLRESSPVSRLSVPQVKRDLLKQDITPATGG